MGSYCIEVVFQGCGFFQADGTTWPLQPGDIFFYGGKTPHAYWTKPENPLNKIWICLRGGGAEPAFREALHGSCGVFSLVDPKLVVEVFGKILYHAAHRSRYSSDLCRRYLDIALLLVQEQQLHLARTDTGDKHAFFQAREHLDVHFARIASIKQAAEEIGMSPSYISRLFKRYHDLTPHQYLLKRKLDVARYKLRSTSQPVKQIAYELGFRDGYELSRAFKREEGVAPSEYRRR
jgi:AraC-like DNA-binding protein